MAGRGPQDSVPPGMEHARAVSGKDHSVLVSRTMALWPPRMARHGQAGIGTTTCAHGRIGLRNRIGHGGGAVRWGGGVLSWGRGSLGSGEADAVPEPALGDGRKPLSLSPRNRPIARPVSRTLAPERLHHDAAGSSLHRAGALRSKEGDPRWFLGNLWTIRAFNRKGLFEDPEGLRAGSDPGTRAAFMRLPSHSRGSVAGGPGFSLGGIACHPGQGQCAERRRPFPSLGGSRRVLQAAGSHSFMKPWTANWRKMPGRSAP